MKQPAWFVRLVFEWWSVSDTLVICFSPQELIV